MSDVDILRAPRAARLARDAEPGGVSLHRLVDHSQLDISHQLGGCAVHERSTRASRSTLAALIAEKDVLAAAPRDFFCERTVYSYFFRADYFHDSTGCCLRSVLAGPISFILCVISLTISANLPPIAEERLNMSIRSGSI